MEGEHKDMDEDESQRRKRAGNFFLDNIMMYKKTYCFFGTLFCMGKLGIGEEDEFFLASNSLKKIAKERM